MSSGSCVERGPAEKCRKSIPRSPATSRKTTPQPAPDTSFLRTSVMPSTAAPGVYGASSSFRVNQRTAHAPRPASPRAIRTRRCVQRFRVGRGATLVDDLHRRSRLSQVGDRRRETLAREEEVDEVLVQLPVVERRENVELPTRRRGDRQVARGPEALERAWATERVLGGVGVTREEAPAVPHADHLPEIVPVDEVPVLVHRFGLEEEGAGRDHLLLVRLPRREDDPAGLVLHLDLDPRLNQVERPGRIVVPHLVRRDHDAQFQGLTSAGFRRRVEVELHDGARGPLARDLRDLDLSLEPLLHERDLLLAAWELQERGHVLVRAEEAMAPVLAVGCGPVVVGRVAGGGLGPVEERHVALAALHRPFRILRVVPLALPPVVVLVLELDPTEVVDLLVDELLVAGGAVLRGLEEAFLEGVHMVARIAPDQEVRRELQGRALRGLEEVALRRLDDVVRVALHVGLRDGVAG